MNIHQFISQMKSISNSDFVSELERWIIEWISNDKDINDLTNMINKFFSEFWIDDEEYFKQYYSVWNNFKESTIDCIGGMTMNERLYFFGLDERFSKLDDNQNDLIYSKLLSVK